MSKTTLIQFCAHCGLAATALVPSGWRCPRCHAETTLPALTETHEYCKRCGKSFHYGEYFCPHCGISHRPPPAASAPKLEELWRRRVSEAELANVLSLLARPPNFRYHPRPEDLQGDYSAWFDGGAMREHTGSRSFFLKDGTSATVASPLPWLSLQISFPDGRQVTVQQVEKR